MRILSIAVLAILSAGCVGTNGNGTSDEKVVQAAGAGVTVSSDELAAIVSKRKGVPAAGNEAAAAAPAAAVTVTHE